MALRPCLDCGHLTQGSRCPTHRRQRDNATLQAKRERRPYTAAERDRRAEAVANHRATHGDWCPGWRREPHEASDLTADHPLAVAAGGEETADLEVLCRSCNGHKGDSLPPPPGGRVSTEVDHRA